MFVAYNNLSSLDLSSNINLKYLNCQNNELNNLILNSEYLIEIYCFENQLTNLDVSQAHLLTYLDCNFNNLFSLDVNQNENLNFLIASGNNLSELNVSNNRDLTYLNVGENNIISLDLSHNQNLISFLAPYNFPLDFLDIRNGNNANMNGINVTGTNALKCVIVDDASASYLDDWYIDPFTTFVNNEAECDALSVLSYEREQLLIYPNPSKSTLTVSFSKPAEYAILDLNGKNLKTGKLNMGLSRIIIDELSTGLYFFKVKTDLGSITKKLIKQ
ncbi:T9SS type A sorting domain-containing protein [Aequorivita sp. F47161]|uniref:T9SS type A sorting domain-containing protein n=1 Tax=Aequorivita vitellina TaxID=2874475 RepID=A0A9X1QTV8_9FLAO|nr:T9SS type A sorting domain-containing protein [Aequorivita vitellina]MCG2418645.1 T9SS type A sorting domain-containing protein [Aequorivita vitellina]